MAIDVRNEQLITFSELARSLPRRRDNRPVNVSTIHRWRSRGLDGGIRLEAVRVGGAWCTSWEAFHRFCDRLTTVRESRERAVAFSSPNRESHRAADRQLQSEGW